MTMLYLLRVGLESTVFAYRIFKELISSGSVGSQETKTDGSLRRSSVELRSRVICHSRRKLNNSYDRLTRLLGTSEILTTLPQR